jgi:hypothetical protein
MLSGLEAGVWYRWLCEGAGFLPGDRCFCGEAWLIPLSRRFISPVLARTGPERGPAVKKLGATADMRTYPEPHAKDLNFLIFYSALAAIVPK